MHYKLIVEIEFGDSATVKQVKNVRASLQQAVQEALFGPPISLVDTKSQSIDHTLDFERAYDN